MSIIHKVGINGFGRIGRLLFRALLERDDVEVTAVNDVVDPKVLVHLLKYDSAQGPLKDWEVSLTTDDIIELKHKQTNKLKRTKVFNYLTEKTYKWGEYGVECVVECSGRNLDRKSVQVHIDSGANKVLISAPAKDEDIKTIVYNVNHKNISASDTVISGASCTTNALAPIVYALNEEFGVECGFMTTIHAFTSDQKLQDAPHSDLRRTRAASNSIIPTSTGAASAIGKVIPSLKGKLDGVAHRVPTLTGSLVDFIVKLNKPVTKETVNAAIKKYESPSLCYELDPIVSCDIIGHTAGSIFDADLTKVLPNGEVKVYMWYDNETSYVHQLVRTLCFYVSL